MVGQFERRLIAGLLAPYLALVLIVTIAFHATVTPDRVVVFLLLVAVVARRGRLFMRDWVPFLALFLAWEALAGYAKDFGFPVHVHSLVDADQSLFGGTAPTVWLQQNLYMPGHPRWWDYSAIAVYLLHFAVPLGAGFAIWLRSRERYWAFVAALMTLSVAAFLTFVFFPAAPPWLAAQQGAIKGVHNIWADVFLRWGSQNASFIYNGIKFDEVAAMPSLHAAYPTLAFLALRGTLGRPAYIMLGWAVVVYISIIYLGHHWFVDVAAGITYAAGAYLAVEWLLAWHRRRAPVRERVPSAAPPGPTAPLEA